MSTAMTNWIESQRAVWGDEYIDTLIEDGYVPIHTSQGWRWILVDADNYATVVEAGYESAVA